MSKGVEKTGGRFNPQSRSLPAIQILKPTVSGDLAL